MELHEEIVCGGAPVDSEFGHQCSGISAHSVSQVSNLVGDSFERGACDVAGCSATGQADDGASCIRVPMRRTQADECGNDVDTAVVVYRCGQTLDVGRGVDDAEAITQPLDDRPADKDAPLQRIVCPPFTLPRDRRQELMV